MMFGGIGLSFNDMKNILLWHEMAFKEKSEMDNSQIKTLIKIQAMVIYEEEDKERHLDKSERF
jgi:hypothetical protein|tara:strand:+ start:263 stop:451 length:189 start_codon:yes stop_codon:yes gene_type:complete